jgi:transposase
MLDETIICETPALYSCYGRVGRQVCVPVTGYHKRCIVHGVINIHSGDVLLLMTQEWVQETHQYFLEMIRSHWRGWHIVLFEDRGSPHRAEESLSLAQDLAMEVRFLPKATSELNAMDQLWRQVKGPSLANQPTRSIEESANNVCQNILNMTPHERLRKAGVLSGNFWLVE